MASALTTTKSSGAVATKPLNLGVTEAQQLELSTIEAMFGAQFKLHDASSTTSGVGCAVGLGVNPENPPQLRVVLTYQSGYPDDGLCLVKCQALEKMSLGRLEQELNGIAKESLGTYCATTILQRAQDFVFEKHEEKNVEPTASSDQGKGGTSAGRTTLIHMDHMNDSKGYTEKLCSWADQLELSGVIFLPWHTEPRPRHIFTLLDEAPATAASNTGGSSATGEFLRRLRTHNVDVNMRGRPCKERMATVVAEMPLGLGQRKSGGKLHVVETEGGKGSQSHLPFLGEWLQQNRAHDGAKILSLMEDQVKVPVKPFRRN